MQRDGDKAETSDWQREAGGGLSIYASHPPAGTTRRNPDAIRQGVVDGAYWLRPPAPPARS